MSREQELRRLSDRYEHRHHLRLATADDRAYHALLHDLLEPGETQPGLADQQHESRTAAAALDDEGDRLAFETRVDRYDGE